MKGVVMGKKKYITHTPNTKKALIGVDENNGRLVYADTGLPVIRTQTEFMTESQDKDLYKHECIACGVLTNAEFPRCWDCVQQDKELENKMKRLARLSREGIIPEDDTNGVRDASYQYNDSVTVVVDNYKTCSNCFIVLPKSFGRKRLCEHCRK
jgi:hypothetical protein|tara:strand:- start:200 stop:661 length:462 start_codon:yes stop_codon:yes gene_type:complete